jgi:phage-related minor tail protein
MALEASVLTVRVQSEGVESTTKALNDLAKAGENAEKKTSNIGSGAKQSAKAQVDAAQQAASAYNAIIDMMTEKANEFYANKVRKAFLASQQEIFEGMALADKLSAIIQQGQADRQAMREKESADIRAKQQEQMNAAQEWYAKQQDLANKMNAVYDKKQATKLDNDHEAAILEDKRRAWKALGEAQAEALRINAQIDAANKRLENDHAAAILEDKKRAWKALGQAQSEAMAMNAKMTRDSQQARTDADEFVKALKRQADTVGMTTKELREYNAEQLRTKAAQLGVSQQVEGYINTLRNAKGPHESFNLLTAGSARELMVLGHELSQGQFNRFYGSLIVLAERINFLPSLLEKASVAATSMGMSLGVLVTAVLTTAAAIGMAIYTFNKSSSALHDMRNAVVLTGDSIGTTGDQLYSMANKIGDSFGSFGKARTAVIELANTGRFTAEQINVIAEAAVGLEKYGGVAIDKTIKQFERLAAEPLKAADKSFKGVSNAAMELNTQLHFLEPAVLAQIMHLERTGDVAGASKIAIAALAEEEKKRIEELKGNLTELGKIMSGVGTFASRMWNNIFHKESDEDELERVVDRINDALKRIGKTGGSSTQTEQLNVWLQQSNEIQERINKKQSKAQAEQAKQKLNDEANLALVQLRNIQEKAKGEENLAAAKARYEKTLNAARERAKTDSAFAANAADFISPEAEKEALAYIERTHNLRQKQPKQDGLAGLNSKLSEVNAQYEIDKRYYDNQVKFIDDLQKKKLISDSAAEHAKKEFLDNQAAMEEKSLNDQLALIDAFHSKDNKLMEQAATKRHEIEKRIEKNQADNAAKKNILATDAAAREQKAQEDADKASNQIISQVASQTQAIQAKIEAYNALPEAVKQAGLTEKQMQDEITQAEIRALDERIAAIKDFNSEAASQEMVRLKAQKKALEDRAKAQKQWEEIQEKNQSNLGRSAALTKVATEQIRMWKDVGSEIEKSLKKSFGAAGDAAGKMFKAFAEGQADQISLMNQARVISENKSLSETEKEKQLNEIRVQSAQNQVGMYGDMASAASLFFEKGSTGYQAMAKAAMILHTAEVALSVIKGVNAILHQAEGGDQYSAFARMAAMAAVVAGLGVAISGSFGSKGGFSSADQQKIQGTGTVLGSPTITDGFNVKLVGAKSDSIDNSLKILEKNSGLGLVVQNDMLTAMTTLSNNITSLAKSIVQNGNLTGNITDNNLSGGFISKMFSSIGNAIFGGKTTVDDTGLKVNAASLAQIAAQGIVANQYTNTTKSGGWFRSDKHNTSLSALDANTTDQFTKVILSMSDTLKTASTSLGVSGDAFNQKLQSFVVDIGNVSLKGMNSDQIQKTLENIFSKVSDQMATFMFADLKQYQKIGEGLMETVSRVANDLMQVNDVFAVLGKTVQQGAQAIATSEQLISEFGSVDNLTKGVKAYIDAIYSDDEKLAPVVKSVNDAFAKLNLTGIKTKEDFKKVVDSIDLTTSAGQDLFAAMMNIAPAFGKVVDAADDAAKKAAEAAAEVAKTVSDGLLSDVDTAFNALSKNISKQKDEISKAADAAKEAAQKQLTAAQSTQSALQTVFDSITSALKNTVADSIAVTKAKRQEAQAYIAVATASVAAGNDVSKMSGLQDALDTLSNPSKDMYGSYQEYAFDQAKTNVSLTKLQSATKGQLDYAKLTVDKLNDTITAIEDQKNAQTEALDNVLNKAQDQIDVLKGQSYSLLSIDQGIAALNVAIQKAYGNTAIAGNSAVNTVYQNALGRTADTAGLKYWNDQIAKGTPISDVTKAIATSAEAQAAIENLYQTVLRRHSDEGGMQFFMDALARGSNLNDISSAMKNSDEYKKLPSFAVGTNNLPEDMIAQLHRGERIIPAADNAALQRKLDKADENSATSAEVSAKLDQLISIVSAGDVSNVNMTRELVKIIKRWDTEGQPETRDVTA